MMVIDSKLIDWNCELNADCSKFHCGFNKRSSPKIGKHSCGYVVFNVWRPQRYLYIKSETLTFPRDLRCHKEIAHFPKHRKEALRFYKGSEKLRKTGKLTT